MDHSNTITKKTLKTLENPYKNHTTMASPEPSSINNSRIKYESLELKAEDLNIINNGRINKLRQGGLPENIRSNKEFTFGVKSNLEEGNRDGKFTGSMAGLTTMGNVMSHSENIMDSLQKKIEKKIHDDRRYHKGHKLQLRIQQTKASNLRSKSVLANKALLDIDRNLDLIRQNKASCNNTSFHDIEKEKQRIAKVILLPPIQKIEQVDQELYKTVVFSSHKKMNQTHNRLASQSNLLKKNFVTITNDQQTAADSNNRRNSMDIEVVKPEKLKTEGMAKSEVKSRTKMSPKELSKQERDEILSQYYSDKRKMQNTINA